MDLINNQSINTTNQNLPPLSKLPDPIPVKPPPEEIKKKKSFIQKSAFPFFVFFLFVLTAATATVLLLNQEDKTDEIVSDTDNKKAVQAPSEEVPNCSDGRNTCFSSPYNCKSGDLFSHELWDSCGERQPSNFIGDFIGLEKAISSCEDNKHILSVKVNKNRPQQEIILHTRAKLCACDSACGVDGNGDGYCRCEECEILEQDETIPSGTASLTLRREVDLPGGGCGSAQIDLYIDSLTVNGIKYDCPLRGWENNPDENGFAWTVWYSGLELDQCQAEEPSPTPTPSSAPSPTPTATIFQTPTPTPTGTILPSVTPTVTVIPSPTPTIPPDTIMCRNLDYSFESGNTNPYPEEELTLTCVVGGKEFDRMEFHYRMSDENTWQDLADTIVLNESSAEIWEGSINHTFNLNPNDEIIVQCRGCLEDSCTPWPHECN